MVAGVVLSSQTAEGASVCGLRAYRRRVQLAAEPGLWLRRQGQIRPMASPPPPPLCTGPTAARARRTHAGIPHLHTPAEVTVGLEAEVERLAAPAAEAAAVCTLSGTAFAAAALRPSLRKSGLMMQRVPQAGPLQCQGALEAGSGRQTPPETQSTSAGQA